MLLANVNGSLSGFDLASARNKSLGHIGGINEVRGLQVALTNLAMVTMRPMISPGPITGIVDAQTITAVIAATDLLSEHLPTKEFVALKVATAAATFSEAARNAAKSAIEQAAVPLTVAANTAAAKYQAGFMPGFFNANFWTSAVGIGVLVVGALVGYKLLIADKPKTA